MEKRQAADFDKAKELLLQGEVVGLPTETVYGLAARIDLPLAIEKIFRVKERPFFDPLIVHVSSIAQAKTLTSDWNIVAEALAKNFWPGPLTLILPKASTVNPMITSGLESVGLRMPRHPLALKLIEAVGIPLAAPSANKFGRTSPTLATHVTEELKAENVFVLDGGPCDVGIESTVLLIKKQTQWFELSILRKGHILESDLRDCLSQTGIPFQMIESVSKKESPGHMRHHYMPSIPLIIADRSADRSFDVSRLLLEVNQKLQSLPEEVEGVRIRKPEKKITRFAELKLSPHPVVAARELYSELRRLGESGVECLIFFKESDQQGAHWESLFDRLNKAASLILTSR